MSPEPRWESVDALLEWLTTAAPIEAAHAAANRRLNAEFHAGLAGRPRGTRRALARITAALADPLARNDLPRFARTCRQAGEDVPPIALG